MKSHMIKKLNVIIIIVAVAALTIIAGCTPTGTLTPTSTVSLTPTLTPTQAPQNQQPIQVVSMIGPIPPYNPGGPTVAITVKNVGVEPVTILKAVLKLEGDFEFAFVKVTPSNPLLPGGSSNQTLNLIGPKGNFTSGILYPLTVNGTLQSGATFAYTWEPIEVISVLDTYKTGQTVNPGGPEIEITLKNAAIEPVVSLAATLIGSRTFNYSFDVTPSNPLLPGKSISSKNRLIGGGFPGGSIPYAVTVNGTLQSGATFAYTWESPK